MNSRFLVLLAGIASALAVGVPPARAADWPAHLGDSRRSASTDEKLEPPLSEVWAHRARHAPRPAWPLPAGQDFSHGGQKLEARAAFDRVDHPVAGGGRVFLGSSADGAVRCLEVKTGEVRWTFFTEGPVRLAPFLTGEKVLFGSDDGCVYCLKAASGELVWKYRPFDEDRRLPGNGRMISLRPVRSGVLVEDGRACACAGIFPSRGVRLFALDVATGEEVWKRDVRVSAQGELASDGKRLFVPTGRTGPAAFDLKTGKDLRVDCYQGAGTRLAVAPSGGLIFQRTRYGHALGFEGTRHTEPFRFAAFAGPIAYLCRPQGVRALKLEGYAQLAQEIVNLERGELGKLRREVKKGGGSAAKAELQKAEARMAGLQAQLKSRVLWSTESGNRKRWPAGGPPYSLVRAGELLFVGGDDSVRALSAKDGRKVWTGKVDGRAGGLAVAGGRLLVSTDKGAIHCFAAGPGEGAGSEARGATGLPDDAKADRIANAVSGAVVLSRGWCLLLGAGDGKLAVAVGRRTKMPTVVLEPDAKKANASRRLLDAAGLGDRVAVHCAGGEKLPYPRGFATAVVVNGVNRISAGEVARVLRPWGGVALAVDGAPLPAGLKRLLAASSPGGVKPVDAGGFRGLRRVGGPRGAGEWTHLYADPGNSACSGDDLSCGPMDLAWFGRPGPSPVIDRHNRPMSPLFAEGRLIVPANERVIALDACSGARLWELELPGSRRVGVMKDSGQMVLGGGLLYVAVKDACRVVDAAGGTRLTTLKLPLPDGTAKADWGYLAVAGGTIFGSGQKPGASFGDHCNMCRMLEGDFRPVIVSDYLFALDAKTGGKKWLHAAGRVFNSAIAVADGKIFFLECHAAASSKTPGRTRIDEILKGETFLVALDAGSGKEAWRREVQLPYQHIVYLSAAEGKVLLSGAHNRGEGKKAAVHYGLFAFEAAGGKPKWQREFNTGKRIGGSHGEQWQHPVIAGGKVYSKSFACDLESGEEIPGWRLKGKGCGTLSASRNCLFARNRNSCMYQIGSREGAVLNSVSRPGCFINIIAAGGMVLVPESSAGCTCGYPIQASFGYAPRERRE